jgi:signal transduction histidine kinase
LGEVRRDFQIGEIIVLCYIAISVATIFFITTIYFSICLRRERNRYKQLLQEGNDEYNALLREYEAKLRSAIEMEKDRQLREAASMTHHLSNVISGMNHELSPWIGGIKNKISRLASKGKSSSVSLSDMAMKLGGVMKACDSMSLILDNLSRDVKKVQKYDLFESNIHETITSWVRLAIADRSIKENISEENFIIGGMDLHFVCNHSPLLVSQVILNLVKNSIEHNEDMLDRLKIRISGDYAMKALIYEDNGSGIPTDRLEKIFIPGMTSKHHDKELHGLGLSLCQDYCDTMEAVLIAERCDTGARFIIYFECDKTQAAFNSKIRRVREERDSSIRTACKLGDRRH